MPASCVEPALRLKFIGAWTVFFSWTAGVRPHLFVSAQRVETRGPRASTLYAVGRGGPQLVPTDGGGRKAAYGGQGSDALVSPGRLDAAFDDTYDTKHVDTIFRRVFD
jgi:hypothetical protein